MVDASGTEGYLNGFFSWDFDSTQVDPLNGSAAKKTGFLAAHIFERPGTYFVVVQAWHADGRFGTSQVIPITVEDPEVAFMPPQGRTLCVAPTQNPNFTGCPSTNPADHLVSDDFQFVINLAQTNTRILFRRGETWNVNSPYSTGLVGPAQFAGFPNPYDRNATRVTLNSVGGDWSPALGLNNATNVFVAGFHAIGPWDIGYTSPRNGFMISNSSNVHFDNIDAERFNGNAFDCGISNSLMISRSTIHYSRGYGSYSGGCTNFVFSQNTISRLFNQQHGIRVQGGAQTLVTENRITDIDSLSSITIRGDHNKILVAKNFLDAINSFSPQDLSHAEHVQNFVMEGNTLVNPPNLPTRQDGVVIKAKDGVIRHNLFYNTNMAISLVDHPLVGGSERIDIYNNSYFLPNGQPQTDYRFLHAQSGTRSVRFFNNAFLLFDVSTSYTTYITAEMAASEIWSDYNIFQIPTRPAQWNPFSVGGAGYTLSSWQAMGKDAHSLQVNPGYTSTPVGSANFLDLAPESPAIDLAMPTAVKQDIYGRPRPNGSAPDCGATEWTP